MEQSIQKELKKCKTLNEVIETMNKYYDLDHPMGPVAKGLVISKIGTVVKMTGAKRR